MVVAVTLAPIILLSHQVRPGEPSTAQLRPAQVSTLSANSSLTSCSTIIPVLNLDPSVICRG